MKAFAVLSNGINRMTISETPSNSDFRWQRQPAALQQQDFDVLVVGGGISGAWLALHCVQSGYRTALIEKSDYASQTSSSSSKTLHGGIRYLQQIQFGKVHESAMERAHYLYAAPHLSAAVPFVIPTYKDFKRSKFFLGCGMLAYQCLCIGENNVIASKEQQLPPPRSISAARLNQICDLSTEPHTGGVMFYERHMLNSERMVLSILQTAGKLGATVVNYVKATELLRNDNRISGVSAQDELTGQTFEINAKLVINAAGPWIDSLINELDDSNQPQNTISGFAVGSHIITKQISDHAIGITTKHQSDAKIDRGGRHVFIIPWRGHSLIGTSYDEIDSPNGDLSLQADHVTQLLEVVNDSLPDIKLGKQDLISGYSGLYPLRTENIQNSVYQGTGEYKIIDHQQANQVDGIITALGAKFTTGRKLSALTMKVVDQKLGGQRNLAKTRLHASNYHSAQQFSNSMLDKYASLLPETTITHLVSHFGSELDALMARCAENPLLLRPLSAHQPDILGQVVWAIEQEQAVTLADVLFRRTSVGFLGIKQNEVSDIAALMATELSWSAEHLAKQLDECMTMLQSTRNALDSAVDNAPPAD